MLGRATPLWILGLVSMVSGLLSTIVILQFVEVLPWVGDPASHIGGPLTGAVTYGLAPVAFGAIRLADHQTVVVDGHDLCERDGDLCAVH